MAGGSWPPLQPPSGTGWEHWALWDRNKWKYICVRAKTYNCWELYLVFVKIFIPGLGDEAGESWNIRQERTVFIYCMFLFIILYFNLSFPVFTLPVKRIIKILKCFQRCIYLIDKKYSQVKFKRTFQFKNKLF